MKITFAPGMTKVDTRNDGTKIVRFTAFLEDIGSVGGSFDPVAGRFYWPEKFGNSFQSSDVFEAALIAEFGKMPKIQPLL